jgi:hypothetical protein
MKCLLLAAALTVAISALAAAEGACVRELREVFTDMGTKQAKRICDPKNAVKPHEYGWVCYVDPEIKIVKEKGQGARLKRDAICE